MLKSVLDAYQKHDLREMFDLFPETRELLPYSPKAFNTIATEQGDEGSLLRSKLILTEHSVGTKLWMTSMWWR